MTIFHYVVDGNPLLLFKLIQLRINPSLAFPNSTICYIGNRDQLDHLGVAALLAAAMNLIGFLVFLVGKE